MGLANRELEEAKEENSQLLEQTAALKDFARSSNAEIQEYDAKNKVRLRRIWANGRDEQEVGAMGGNGALRLLRHCCCCCCSVCVEQELRAENEQLKSGQGTAAAQEGAATGTEECDPAASRPSLQPSSA